MVRVKALSNAVRYYNFVLNDPESYSFSHEYDKSMS